MGLIGSNFNIKTIPNSPTVLVETGGSLGNFVIDLKIVAVAVAIFVTASLLSAPLSYILVGVGAVVLTVSYKKFDQSLSGTGRSWANFLYAGGKDNLKELDKTIGRALNGN